MDFPKICGHYGWDEHTLCGPVTMAFCQNRESNCCFGHPSGSPLHKAPTYQGKPFVAKEHEKELVRLGFTTVQKQLKAEMKDKAKPPGQPKRVGTALVYPARHFG